MSAISKYYTGQTAFNKISAAGNPKNKQTGVSKAVQQSNSKSASTGLINGSANNALKQLLGVGPCAKGNPSKATSPAAAATVDINSKNI